MNIKLNILHLILTHAEYVVRKRAAQRTSFGVHAKTCHGWMTRPHIFEQYTHSGHGFSPGIRVGSPLRGLPIYADRSQTSLCVVINQPFGVQFRNQQTSNFSLQVIGVFRIPDQVANGRLTPKPRALACVLSASVAACFLTATPITPPRSIKLRCLPPRVEAGEANSFWAGVQKAASGNNEQV